MSKRRSRAAATAAAAAATDAAPSPKRVAVRIDMDAISRLRMRKAVIAQLLDDLEAMSIHNKPITQPFKELPSENDEPAYYQEIEKPIDFKSIRAKLNGGRYKLMRSFFDDMLLLTENALAYHRPASHAYKCALKIQETTLQRFETLLADSAQDKCGSQKARDAATTEAESALLTEEQAAALRSIELLKARREGAQTPSAVKNDRRRGKIIDALYASAFVRPTRHHVPHSSFPLRVRNKHTRERHCELFIDLPPRDMYPDYYEIIATPICINDLKQRVREPEYFLEDLMRDIRTMFDNAFTYNSPGTIVFDDALALLETAENMLTRFLDEEAADEAKMASKKKKKARPILPSSPRLGLPDGNSPPSNIIPITGASYACQNRSYYTGPSPRTPHTSLKTLLPLFVAQIRRLLNAIRSARNEEDGYDLAEPFLELPDRKQWAIYYQVIQKPISLEQIEDHLQKAKYANLDAALADLDLMFDNATTFNQADSELYQALAHETVARLKQERAQTSLAAASPAASGQASQGPPIKIRLTNLQRPGATTNAEAKSSASAEPTAFRLLQDRTRYMLASDVANALGNVGSATKLFERYTGLWRRPLSQKERGYAADELKRTLPARVTYIVKASEAQALLKGQGEDYIEANTTPAHAASAAVAAFDPEDAPVTAEDATPVDEEDDVDWYHRDPSVYRAKKPMELRRLVGRDLWLGLLDNLRQYTNEADDAIAEPFWELPTREELKDYYLTISSPKDLKTVYQNVKADRYTSAEAFVADTVLVFHNAMVYNHEASVLCKFAQSLLQIFQTQARRFLPAQAVCACPGLKTISPLSSLALALLSAMRAMRQGKRALCEEFISLPDPDEFPDYYVAISKPITLATIHENIFKETYHNLEEFVDEVKEMFYNARFYNEPSSSVNLSAPIHQDSIALQQHFVRKLHQLCAQQNVESSALRYTKEQFQLELAAQQQKIKAAVTAIKVAEIDPARRNELASYQKPADSNGPACTVPVGSYVLLANDSNPKKPKVAQVESIFDVPKMGTYLEVSYFWRPEETYHVPTKTFYANEVMAVKETYVHAASDILRPCAVMFIRDYLRFEPADIPEKDVFVCESRYNAKTRQIKPVKQWQAPKHELATKRRAQTLLAHAIPRVKSVYATADMLSGMPMLSDARNKVATDVQPPAKLKGYKFFSVYYMDNRPLCPGDYVYFKSEDDQPHLARIDFIYEKDDGNAFFVGQRFLYPGETMHQTSRLFYPNEVLHCDLEAEQPVQTIITHAYVLYISDYVRRRPLSISPSDVHVCDSSYLPKDESIVKIKGIDAPPLLEYIELPSRLTIRRTERSPLVHQQREQERAAPEPTKPVNASEAKAQDSSPEKRSASERPEPEPVTDLSTGRTDEDPQRRKPYLNPFMAFARYYRHELLKQDEMPDDIGSAIEDAWDELSEEEKTQWGEQARQETTERQEQLLPAAPIYGKRRYRREPEPEPTMNDPEVYVKAKRIQDNFEAAELASAHKRTIVSEPAKKKEHSMATMELNKRMYQVTDRGNERVVLPGKADTPTGYTMDPDRGVSYSQAYLDHLAKVAQTETSAPPAAAVSAPATAEKRLFLEAIMQLAHGFETS
ncbi:uncharacterized protein MONBRDRAFT_34273 [Monosiga brevicollis MX1]|uniref:Polybromo-1 n=1 Tax=Monosiga brevicollis TaxID=81824 RepID=A9VAM3_MONBE|nr:uncharacterized protein MONBRDRAFT_34273 [Monosiga brevicollis MX1]EDQ85398.1 predicted protein [Monosiga brevicollis MX1]|eukprot:XP_001749809.1 hypothetical protein [Monosiga brevicollis MX1]